MQLKRISIEGAEPITLAEAKLFLRITGTGQDDLITELITVVREMAEDYMGRSVVAQTWQMLFDDAVGGKIPLLRSPIIAISSVKSVDESDAETVIDSGAYSLNTNEEIVFESYVSGHKIVVEYTAGYTTVPTTIKQGMLMHIVALHDDRTNLKLPKLSMDLYKPYRILKL